MGKRGRGGLARALVLLGLATVTTAACSAGASGSGGAARPVVAPPGTVAALVSRADRALGLPFNATYEITTMCGVHGCAQTTEVWQLSQYRAVERFGETGEIIFPGPYSCQKDAKARRWGCRAVTVGMSASMLLSDYPPELLEGDLAGLGGLARPPVYMTHRDVDGQPTQCLLFGPARSPSATVCIDADGLVAYLSTSIGPDNGFDGTVEMTGFSRKVPPSVFELPGPVSKLS